MPRSPALDLLRALAITWVLLYHALVLRIGEPVLPVARLGWMGVDLFFVLSGLLIGTQWLTALRDGRPRALRGFWARRALRILPAYLVVVAIYAGLPALRERPELPPVPQLLTFTENLLVDMSTPKAFSHVWSLCVEEHFYLLFPLISLALARRGSPRATAGALAAVVLAGVAWRAHVWTADLADAGDALYPRFYEEIYYPTWSRLDGLVAGVALATLRVHRPAAWAWIGRRRALVLTAGALAVAAAIAVFGEDPTAASVVVGYPLLAAGLAGIVAAAEGWRVRVPGAGAIATLAYSVYLTHKLVFVAVQRHGGDALAGPVAFAAYAAATLAAGAALHFAVERPFLWLRERDTWRTWPPPARTASPSATTSSAKVLPSS